MQKFEAFKLWHIEDKKKQTKKQTTDNCNDRRVNINTFAIIQSASVDGLELVVTLHQGRNQFTLSHFSDQRVRNKTVIFNLRLSQTKVQLDRF